ncbi:response regulator transcription factor [Flammeovirga sp. EKP202]|uniref:response regulator transcription factor n=1 Tax=Flammeovirga sp. EKP202 TaxID=2770592 RepID=UPI00165FF6F8|nr:response regulator transcription factor [Flammeovirga sp. EKP202]MBD0404217.1 response regulator transcription factor [Flammeovirga sp. EKP202]
MINVFLVDDHEMIRVGLKQYLEKTTDVECVGEAENGVDCLEKLKKFQPHIVVTDLNMPEMDGIELAKEIVKGYPGVKVLGLTMMDDHRYVKQFLAEGASGYLLKDCKQEELLLAIRTVNSGGTFFSPKVTEIIINSIQKTKPHAKRMVTEVKLSRREKEVLDLILKEYSNSEIAEALFVSMKTVEAHKRNLLVKTGSKNIAGLILYAIGANLTDF